MSAFAQGFAAGLATATVLIALVAWLYVTEPRRGR